jgi:hypothetical protein
MEIPFGQFVIDSINPFAVSSVVQLYPDACGTNFESANLYIVYPQ